MFPLLKNWRNQSKKVPTIFLGLLTLGLILISNHTHNQQEITHTEFLMNTIFEIKASGPQARKAIQEAFRKIKKIEKITNRFEPKSEVSRLNKLGANLSLPVSEELFRIIENSIWGSKITGGAFDISIAPLVNLWSSTIKKNRTIPSAKQIALIKAKVNYQNIKLNKAKRETKFLKKGMQIDLGGVAKGYAVDQAVAILEKYGVKQALINGGGNIRVIGTKPDGKGWSIALQHPREKDKILGILFLQAGQAVATSGNYQRFFIYKGKRYGHILNPKTGEPASECQSVTILANKATAADILSTGIFVLGPKEGLAFLKKLPQVEGIIITNGGEILISSGLKNSHLFKRLLLKVGEYG